MTTDELKRLWLHDARSLAAVRDLATPLTELMRVSGAFSRPATWLQDVPGYGLPQAAERAALSARVQEDAGRRRAQLDAIEAALPNLLSPDRRAALEGTKANVALVSERLRALSVEG